MIGLLAYSMIPNIHTLSFQSSQQIVGPTRILVSPNFQSETHQNVNISSGTTNELVANVSVSLESGGISTINFKLFTQSHMGSCLQDPSPSSCLVDRKVSNETIRIPLNASTTYYFAFENKDSSGTRLVRLSASLISSSVYAVAQRDGSLNFAGLGLGLVGLAVALYGVVAKTVIPWE